MAQDLYKTLGVARDASQSDIQKAYRGLARKYHPDMNPDDKTAKKKFQEVQAAFDVLNDPTKRENYDRYGSAVDPRSAGAAGGPGGPGGFEWNSQAGPGFEDFSEMFGERFGADAGGAGGFGDIFGQFRQANRGRKTAGQPRHGADVTSELQISFNTAVLGGEAQISVQRVNGHVETLTVKIPPGIDEGKKIRLRGQGEQTGGRGTPGDIIILVHVAPHPFFQRHGNDLTVKVPVTLAEAALGGKVDVPTPQGVISLRIPPGTSSGTRLRAKGRGVAPKSGAPGDLYAELQITLPKPLDEEAQAQLRKLDEHWNNQQPQDPRRSLKW